jgi:hypothetical protein
MKTLVTTFVVCLLVAGVTAQQNPPPAQQNPPAQQTEPQKPAVPEVTLTGCLVQGSTPAVFIFENVKKDPKNETEAAVKYIVVASTEDLNLRSHLNHQVRISGVPDGKIAPPTTQKVEEKDLPRLSAKGVTMVSDTCSTPRR